MQTEYLEEYNYLKKQYERELKQNPEKEKELHCLYLPVLGYHAAKYTDRVLLDIRYETNIREQIQKENAKSLN